MSDARFLGTLWRNLIAGWHTLMFCDEPLPRNLLTVKKPDFGFLIADMVL